MRHVAGRSSSCSASNGTLVCGCSMLLFSFSSCSASSGTACWLLLSVSDGLLLWPGRNDIGIVPEGVVGAERDNHRLVLLREVCKPNGMYSLPRVLLTLYEPMSLGLRGRCCVQPSLLVTYKTGVWFCCCCCCWQGKTVEEVVLLVVMECPLDRCGSCCILSNSSRNWKKAEVSIHVV